VGTDSDTPVQYTGPVQANPVSGTCTDQNGTVVVRYDSPQQFGTHQIITVPASAIKPQTSIACTITFALSG
jgi:hypothetical protein